MTVSSIILSQAEEFAIASVKRRHPDLDLRPGTPQYDIHVRPFLPIIADIVEQQQVSERKRTPRNWQDLTNEEMDAEATRRFLTRNEGTSAVGSIRFKVKEPVDIRLTTDNVATQSDLEYHPVADVSLAKTSLNREPTLGYYYIDVAFRASEKGSKFEAPVGTTFTVDAFEDDPNLIEAIASSPVQGGLDDEDNESLYRRIQQSAGVRNLINPPSVEAVLREKFKGVIGRLLVIGHQEPEMRRDLKAIVDQKLGPISIHLGNHTDVYVTTPIVRQAVEMALPAGEAILDLSAYRAVLKVHGVSVKEDPGVTPYFALVDGNVETRYSGLDSVKLLVDPGVGGRTLVIDMSYAPDVVTINDYVNSEEVRNTNANMLIRYYHPVFLDANIYVEGAVGRENEVRMAVNRYLAGLTGKEYRLVVSRITEAIHNAGVGNVHQDYGIQATLAFGDGEPLELFSDNVLELPNRYEKGFSPRVAHFINEGIQITAIS